MKSEIKQFIIDLNKTGLGPKAIALELDDLYGLSSEDSDQLYHEALGITPYEQLKAEKALKTLQAYEDHFAEECYELILLGKGFSEIAQYFKGDNYILNSWRDEIPEFGESWNRALKADRQVAKSLLKLCLGYEEEDMKVFQFQGEAVYVPYLKKYQPDLSAIKTWLQSKHPAVWKETQIIESTITHDVKNLTDEQLNEKLESFGVSVKPSALSSLEVVE